MPSQLRLQRLIDLLGKQVQEADRDAAPLDNDIVAGLEHGRNLDAPGASALAVFGVVLQAALLVIRLESENTKVNEEAAVSVFGQSGKQVLASELDLHDALHGLHEGVGEPLCELVEGQDALPWRDAVGLAGRVGKRGEGRAGG